MLPGREKMLLGSPYNHLKEGRASRVSQLLNEAISMRRTDTSTQMKISSQAQTVSVSKSRAHTLTGMPEDPKRNVDENNRSQRTDQTVLPSGCGLYFNISV